MSTKNRADSSAQNNASFSASTVFLKTRDHKYKPAQLCYIAELDTSFLELILEDDEKENLNSFLQFLGVSPEKNYLVVEKIVYDKYDKGLDFIPATWQSDSSEKLTSKKILPDLRVILSSKREVHPALINYNKYDFLTDVSNKKIRKQLEPLLIGKYKNFPSEFTTILFDKLKLILDKESRDVFQLYAFNLF